MAQWDVLGTVALAWVTALVVRVDPWRALVVWALVGAVLHRLLLPARNDTTWSTRMSGGRRRY